MGQKVTITMIFFILFWKQKTELWGVNLELQEKVRIHKNLWLYSAILTFISELQEKVAIACFNSMAKMVFYGGRYGQNIISWYESFYFMVILYIYITTQLFLL